MGIKQPEKGSLKKEPTPRPKPIRRPTIDLGACTRCGGCVEIAPEIFQLRPGVGFVEIRELDFYDPELVEEAMKWCPEDCIYWEDE